MRLIIIRHGQTDVNKGGLMHKVFDKELLNQTGIVQMNQVGRKLRSYDIEYIYSSKEQRVIDSAQIISDELGVDIIEITGLEERDWGNLAGRPWREVKDILKDFSLEERYKYVPENGESWKSFESRLISVVETIVSNSKKDVVVVTHSGAIRALIPYLLDKPLSESFKYEFENASISIFEITQEGFKLIEVNSTDHLN